MQKLQQIKRNQQTKYDEIIEYLKQDNGYWLENDKWDFNKEFFIGKSLIIGTSGYASIDFSNFKNQYMKNEIKFYVCYSFKNKLLKNTYIAKIRSTLNIISAFLNETFFNLKTLNDINNTSLRLQFDSFLLRNHKLKSSEMKCLYGIMNFIIDFYDNREETQKDIWYARNIKGAKIPASGMNNPKNISIRFHNFPAYYKETVKRYFKSFITKKSWSHCWEISTILNYFFDKFYSNGYGDGFVENLSRQDIENYLYWVNNDYKDKNATYKSKFISYIRTFLEYIQIAQYDKAPKKEILFLIFQDDIPRREFAQDEIRRVKFVPEPILKQLDNNIVDLDRPQFIPIYILLRETGWRGTDILNLRYNNCLEKIWNNKEKIYNYNLCGEITKTGIAKHKIPIRDKVADMIEKCIAEAKELSTEENNPKKYLFNTYEGKLKGNPLPKATFLLAIKRLIKQKEIIDPNTNELYHLRLHSLRHTRAKEYVEQGMGISVIQQILGHRSLQMTVHYATVTENTLYEKWKSTEDLDLFRVNTETHKLEQVDLSSDDGENLIRYEYVKKNLDAVRVPFGVCFKPSKLPCKQQMNFCLTCASFCTTTENIPEYEEEIDKVKKQIVVSERCGRELWADKNRNYLELLEDTLDKVKTQKIVHKNGKSREELV